METAPTTSHWAKVGTGRWHYCYYTGTPYCGAKTTGTTKHVVLSGAPAITDCCKTCQPRYENEVMRAAQAANKAIKSAHAAGIAKQQLTLF